MLLVLILLLILIVVLYFYSYFYSSLLTKHMLFSKFTLTAAMSSCSVTGALTTERRSRRRGR